MTSGLPVTTSGLSWADHERLPGLLPETNDHDTAGFFAAAAREDWRSAPAPPASTSSTRPAVCARCGGWDTVAVRGRGGAPLLLDAVEHQVHPAFPVPYTIVLVELDDFPGVRYVGQIPGRHALAVDTPMQVWFEEVADGVVIPNWVVADELNVCPTKTDTGPFDRGSFSLKIHPILESADVAAQMVALAEAAEAAGFDGVTISEHHGNYPMYMGQPMLACNWMLAATNALWAAPCPTLLPLRNPRLVAEELAWTAMRFPGRIALGIASGYYEDDFRAVDVPFEDRSARFVVAIEELVKSLSPTGPLADDPAVRSWPAHGGPIVSAVNSHTAARRAATNGLGILIPGHGSLDALARRIAAYRDAGGAGPVVLTKRIWIGTPPGGRG